MSANFSFVAAKVQQNLRMCKFWVEKVLRVVKVLWARGGNTRGRNRETRQVAGMTRGKIRGH